MSSWNNSLTLLLDAARALRPSGVARYTRRSDFPLRSSVDRRYPRRVVAGRGGNEDGPARDPDYRAGNGSVYVLHRRVLRLVDRAKDD